MLRTIAYAPNESVLLTFEGKQLFAFDATTGAALWQLELPSELAAIAFVAPNATGPAPATSPWRSGMSGDAAIAVDREGALHLIDAKAGRLVKTTEPFGAPTAVASSGSAFALGVADRVIVWRDGAKSEVPTTSSALGFANDGTLAIATQKGAVTIGAESAKQLDANVLSLAWSARTGWLAGTDRGLFSVATARKLVEGRVSLLALDQPSARVAIPRGEQTLLVYAWPVTPFALTKVALKGRALSDLAFGPNGRLAVGLNRADASIVDVVEQTAKNVERHPGREPAKFELAVGIDPAKLPPPAKTSFAKVGFGSLAAIVVAGRLVVALMRGSSPSPTVWQPPPDLSKLLACDVSCESGRLADLRKACAATDAVYCSSESEAAEQSFMASDCDAARTSLAAIENKMLTAGSEGTTGILTDTLLAKNGLDLACKQTIKDGVVQFSDWNLHPDQQDLHPGEMGGSSGKPFDVFSNAAGVKFVTVVDHDQRKCALWDGTNMLRWDDLGGECTSAQMFGRDGEIYIAAGGGLWRYAETKTSSTHDRVAWKGATPMQVTGERTEGGDLWITTDKNELAHLHAGKWTTEKLPRANLVLGALALVDDTVLLGAVDSQSATYLFLRRDDAGKWTTTQSAVDPDPIYVGPDGVVYVGRGNQIATSFDKGLTWRDDELPMTVEAIWSRGYNEVYAGGSAGLMRWSGKAWAKTGFAQPLIALTGNSHALLGIVAHKP